MDIQAGRCAQVFEQSAVFNLPSLVVHVLTMSKMTRTDMVREITLIVIQTDGVFKPQSNKTDKSFQIVAKGMQALGVLFQV